jgi:protein-disulfide isomerase
MEPVSVNERDGSSGAHPSAAGTAPLPDTAPLGDTAAAARAAEAGWCAVPWSAAKLGAAGSAAAAGLAAAPDAPDAVGAAGSTVAAGHNDTGALLAAPGLLGERPSRGDRDAPVVLVEYGDFQCPYCAQAAPVLHELIESEGSLVRHEFRHFPVFEVHPYALTAALAAEVSHAYGRFWAMHDLLFAHQDRLKDVDLRMRAERIGIDPALVVGDPAQPYGEAVEADYERGVAEGVRGTPTLYINGQQFRGRPELPALRRAVRVAATSALASAWADRR